MQAKSIKLLFSLESREMVVSGKLFKKYLKVEIMNANMHPKNLPILVFVIAVFLISCTQQQVAVVQKPADIPDTETGPIEEQPQQPPEENIIPPDIKELFGKSKESVGSIYYKYRGPETGSNFHEFYIKGDNIKYRPYNMAKFLEKPESYDVIFIDNSAKTAMSYCEASFCTYKGKKQDLNYGEAYIGTVFDWIDVKSAEKLGEEQIDSRSTWKIQTEKGIIWVDLFYGIPLKAESNGKTYRFEQISVNGVKQPDVVPSP